MTTLKVRLDDTVMHALQQRASQMGRSAEEEALRIVSDVVMRPRPAEPDMLTGDLFAMAAPKPKSAKASAKPKPAKSKPVRVAAAKSKAKPKAKAKASKPAPKRKK